MVFQMPNLTKLLRKEMVSFLIPFPSSSSNLALKLFNLIGYLLPTAYINTPLLLPHSLLLRRRTNVRNVSKYPSSLRCLIYIFITIYSIII